jgi:deoxycytidylate deaminase
MSDFELDWTKLAFSSKKDKISKLQATFIAAPREFSAERLKQLCKTYLAKGPIILGLAKEQYVEGFEDQPQFKMLRLTAAHQRVIDLVNTNSPVNKIYTLRYFQRETPYLFDALRFRHIALVNGSWKYTFHTQKPFAILAKKRATYEFISPFSNEAEAVQFEHDITTALFNTYAEPSTKQHYSEPEMLEAAAATATLSYDYSYQTGVALGKKVKTDTYKLLGTTFNKVVPFQTFAMHYGNSREKHFSPPNDLNHYDTVHAEVELLIRAQKEQWDLRGSTLFINLLPCPSCSRMLSETDIAEFVYAEDHSAGYAVALLEKAGKKVRRVVGAEALTA